MGLRHIWIAKRGKIIDFFSKNPSKIKIDNSKLVCEAISKPLRNYPYIGYWHMENCTMYIRLDRSKQKKTKELEINRKFWNVRLNFEHIAFFEAVRYDTYCAILVASYIRCFLFHFFPLYKAHFARTWWRTFELPHIVCKENRTIDLAEEEEEEIWDRKGKVEVGELKLGDDMVWFWRLTLSLRLWIVSGGKKPAYSQK